MREYMESLIEKYEMRLKWLELEGEMEENERSRGVYEGMAFYSKDFIKDLQEAKSLLKELQEASEFLQDLQLLKECSK